jgi:hypothetical protein
MPATPRRRPIATAPGDGTRLKLFGTREPRQFVGIYSEKFHGWVNIAEIVSPRIRHDITHWTPAPSGS